MIVPHAAQKTEKKVGDVSFWMQKKDIDKKQQTNKTKEDVDRKFQIVFILFFFAMLYLSCENNFILYENKKCIYFHTSLAPP